MCLAGGMSQSQSRLENFLQGKHPCQLFSMNAVTGTCQNFLPFARQQCCGGPKNNYFKIKSIAVISEEMCGFHKSAFPEAVLRGDCWLLQVSK